jgi:uncharacterized protein
MASALEWLEHQQYIQLTTFKRDGTRVPTPVWFAISDGKIYVYSEGDAGKVKRIRATGKIEVAPCTIGGKVTGPVHSGTGTVLDDGKGAWVHGLLNSKYTWKKRIFELGGQIPILLRLRKAKPEGYLELTLT